MSEKIENLLNLALEATEEERMESGELGAGYDPVEREWELIVKYSGDAELIRQTAVSVTELLGGYAVIVIKESRIEELAALDGVEFIEKPKNLYFQVENGRRVSCIDEVQSPPPALSGRGVLVGVVDSGIDYENPDFRNEDGTTRIAALWDQTIPGNPPEGYTRGTEYTREQIDEALSEADREKRLMRIPSRDRAPSPASSTVLSLFTAATGTDSTCSARSTMIRADTFIPGFRAPYSSRRMVTG